MERIHKLRTQSVPLPLSSTIDGGGVGVGRGVRGSGEESKSQGPLIYYIFICHLCHSRGTISKSEAMLFWKE